MTGTALLNRPVASSSELAALAAAVEVVGADGSIKTDFLVLPYGDPIEARDGRKFVLRAGDHAQRVLAATRELLGATEMMIDYDHQAAYAAEGNGNRAEASGWVKDIRAEADGIHVTVDWTEEAKAALAARKYRYISPDFRFAKSSGEVTRIIRAGLTNSPALDLPALAHSRGAPSGEDQDMKTITLGLAALATALALKEADLGDETKALAAIADLVKARDAEAGALTAIRSELELDADADEAVAIAAIRELGKPGAPDPKKFVPKAGYDELSARLATIEEGRILASVDQAVADGKIAPSMKQWAIDLGKKDEPALASFIATAAPFAGSAAVVQGDGKPEKGKLTAEEKAICSLTGASEADFLKTRDSALAEEAA